MKRHLTSLAVLLIVRVAAWAQITDPAPYCASSFDYNYNMFNTLSVAGTNFSFGAMGTFGDFNTYQYYNTTSFPNLTQGGTADIILDVYAVNDIEPAYFAIWIDFNHNNAFESTELIMQNSNTTMDVLPTWGAATSPISKTINIPATATIGTTRMRVMRGTDTANPFGYSANFLLSACNATPSNSYGCTYDFDVNIVGNTTGTEQFHQSALSISPNPASQTIVLSNFDKLQTARISIVNPIGQEVYSQARLSSANSIDLTGLANGLYFIKVSQPNGEIFTGQFIKN